MASKASVAIALLLSLNLLFFSMANADIITLTQCPNYDVNVCVNVLGGSGGGLTKGCACCNLIATLVAAEAELCLCAIVKANILGVVSVDASLELQLMLNDCGIQPPKTYSC